MTPIERLREAAAVPADDVTVSRTDLASVLAWMGDVLDVGEEMAMELRGIASDITPRGMRGQIVNLPYEVAAMEKARSIKARTDAWGAVLSDSRGDDHA